MISIPNMFILGSADRNVGKTEFACRVIRQYADITNTVGVKITTIKEINGKCPRGGNGCGVCGSFSFPYEITRETSGPAGKDTTRMIDAGAHTVYWLRVHQKYLEEGVADLMARIPDDAAIICESNSARLAIEPGLFIVIKNAESPFVKSSCRQVIGYADAVIEFDGIFWDVAPHQCLFRQGEWQLASDVSAVILAGGKSSRMGRDKSMMNFAGKPLIQHIAEQLKPFFRHIIIGANDIDKYLFLSYPVVCDELPDKGPLMGILSCVAAAESELAFVTGCDIPTMHIGLIQQMISMSPGYDIVMPVSPDGRYEPLFALYRKTIVEPAREIISGGGRRIIELFNKEKVCFVDMPDTGWYRNINTVQDFRSAEKGRL